MNMLPTKFEYSLSQSHTYWSLCVKDYLNNGMSFEVRIQFDYSPRQDVKLIGWQDGEEFEVLTADEYRTRVKAVAENEGLSEEDAEAEVVGGDVILADPCGIPAKTMVEQALSRWEAIKLLVSPAVAS